MTVLPHPLPLVPDSPSEHQLLGMLFSMLPLPRRPETPSARPVQPGGRRGMCLDVTVWVCSWHSPQG